MMHTIHAENVSVALSEAIHHLYISGVRETSRNGTVLVAPTPVITTYYQPQKRVLMSPMRDANPFFHMMEALWMLNGSNDLAWPLKFNSRFGEYSDDGKTIWGAYGWRWRQFFGYDQLQIIITELKRNPNSRRCVLSMWNAMPTYRDVETGIGMVEEHVPNDLYVMMQHGKDVPCNTHAYFDVRGGQLNMTVCNRSNDAIWGAYGANAVHFSMLLEYMAGAIGVPMGVYRQFSNNLHIYTDIFPEEKLLALAGDVAEDSLYDRFTQPMVDCPLEEWEGQLHRFIRRDGIPNQHGWGSKFFRDTARNMYMAWEQHKEKDYEQAIVLAHQIAAADWRMACVEWLQRRQQKHEGKEHA